MKVLEVIIYTKAMWKPTHRIFVTRHDVTEFYQRFGFLKTIFYSLNKMLKGYYLKSWECSAKNLPSGTNAVVYFSGWSDINSALEESNECKVKAALGHTSYISFGGGNANGRLTAKNLAGFTDAINNGKLSGYNGIAIDAEEGDGGIESSYDTLISAAKNKGLKVLVTVSHSAPYNVADSETLMTHLIKNKNIDFLSPQLYSSG
jgi:chitinase